MKKKNILLPLFTIFIALIVCLTSISLKAAEGYTYDHKKKLIYSAEGMTVNEVYDTKRLFNANISYYSLFKSPEDLFVYTDEFNNMTIYIVDSSSGKLFIFDKDLTLIEMRNSFVLKLDSTWLTPDENGVLPISKIKTTDANNKSINLLKTSDRDGLYTIEDLEVMTEVNINLASPTCVFRSTISKISLTEEVKDYIYICDNANNQVIVVNSTTFEVVKFVTSPPSTVFSAASFNPRKVITDNAGRIYVTADNVFEGILQFSVDCQYNRFTGVNYVTLTPWDIFWRNFATESQIAKKSSIINTSFTSMAVDVTGTFIYTTSNAIQTDKGAINDKTMIKKINPAGKDVLRKNGYSEPKGDIIYIASSVDVTIPSGATRFVGIDVNQYGIYTALDTKLGRLFTYDNEGNLLYISGGLGKQITALNNPIAIQYYDDEKILVLDKGSKTVLLFEPTEIGGIINKAAIYEYLGETELAAEEWKKVVRLNANYEYAYVGIGKDYMVKKDYNTALEYFKLGANKKYYSKAFKLYRDANIKKYFPTAMIIIFSLIVLRLVLKIVFGKKKIKVEETGVGDE